MFRELATRFSNRRAFMPIDQTAAPRCPVTASGGVGMIALHPKRKLLQPPTANATPARRLLPGYSSLFAPDRLSASWNERLATYNT